MSDDQFYVGSADPSAAAGHFNPYEFQIHQALSMVNTATVAKIVKAPYDKDGKAIPPGTVGPIGYVDVQPMVHQLDGRGKATPHGTVYRLSYFRYQGGDTAVIFDPKVDDIGVLVVSNRDTSSVRANDKPSNPGSRRKFDLADGTFFPISQGKAPKQWVSGTDKGLTVHDRNGNEIVMNDKGNIFKDNVNGNLIEMTVDGVKINGAVISKAGDVTTKHGTSLDKHVNTKVMGGPDNSGPPP